MTRALEPTEIAVYGADAVIDEKTNLPISRSSIKLRGDTNHQAALDRAKAALANAPSEAVTKQTIELIRDSSSDKATVARVEKIAAATQALNAATAANEKSSRELDTKRVVHLKQIADERAANDAAMASDRAAFEQERTARFADLAEREEGLKKRENELKTQTAHLAEQLREVDRKVNAIREAAR